MSSTRTTDELVRIAVLVVAVLLLAPLLMMAFMMPMVGLMGGWGGGVMDGASPLWGLGTMLVWLVVLVGVVYLVYRAFAGGTALDGDTDRAMEELRVAYARGELSEEEFEQRRRNLRRGD